MKTKEIINWIVYFICLMAAVFLINTFVVQRTMVSGESMYPPDLPALPTIRR